MINENYSPHTGQVCITLTIPHRYVYIEKEDWKNIKKEVIREFLENEVLLSPNMEKGTDTFSKCASVFNDIIRHKIKELEGAMK